MSDIRALTFDVFGTVVDWRTSVARELEKALSAKGVSTDWYGLADQWRDLYGPSMEPIRNGSRPYVALDILHRENLVSILGTNNIVGLSETEVDLLSTAWHRLDPWPDCEEGLKQLKQNHILATLSNGNIALMVNLARHGNLPWDAILGAEIAKSYKPVADVYLKTASALGLPPDQCLMVAAHNSDLHVAGSLGFKTAFVSRPTEHGDAQDEDLEPDGEWDFVCTSFTELAAQLDERD